MKKIALLGLVLISSCFNKSLPVLPSQPQDTPSKIGESNEQKISLTENRNRKKFIEQLTQNLTLESANDSALEELIRLLVEMNSSPKDFALSMKELKALQDAILQSDMQLFETLFPRDSKDIAIQILNTQVDKFNLDEPTTCPTPDYEIKTLPSGLRIVSNLPRKDNCSLALSRIYQDLLNKILKGSAADWVYQNKSFQSRNLNEFFDQIQGLGFDVEVSYRLYIAPFVRAYQATGDLYEPSTELPLPLWIKTEIKTQSANEVIIPAPHSEVFFRIKASQNVSESHFKIFFSDKGFVFDDDDLFLPAWSGERILEVIEPKQRPRLMVLIQDLYQTFEIFKNRAPNELPMGGFGVLGVCNDGSAMLMKGLRGPSFVSPFPLVRTDRIKMPDSPYPQKELWESTFSDTSQNHRIPRTSMLKRILISNPFENSMNPFPNFEKLIQELKAEDSP